MSGAVNDDEEFSMRPAIDITNRRFQPGVHRVAVYRNHLRVKRNRDYVWKIDALEGSEEGKTVGIATEVPLIGPVGLLPGSNPAATGYLSLHPLILNNAQHWPLTGRWGRAPDAAILTSDSELWVVVATRQVVKS